MRQRMRLTGLVRGFAATGVALAFCGAAVAEDEGITVMGSGEARARPARVEIHAAMTGASPVPGDAAVKYRDLKRRVEEALRNLKLGNLATEEGGISVSVTNANNNGNGDEGQVGSFQVSSGVRLVLSKIGELKDEQVLDAIVRVAEVIKDSGLTLGPPQDSRTLQMVVNPQSGEAGPIVFRLADAEALRERACELAIANARKKAERLAKLTNVKLGRVLAVEDIGGPNGPMYEPMGNQINVGVSEAANQPAAAVLTEIGVTADVRVRFAIEK